MGFTVVTSITFAQPRIGATAVIGILIAGQLVMGAAIDRFGLFGVDQIAISPTRAAGILLLGIGAALSLVRRPSAFGGGARGEGLYQAACSARPASRPASLGDGRDGRDAPCTGPHRECLDRRPTVSVNPRTKVWVALGTVYVIWGSTYLGIYYAGRTIPPHFAASTRFITQGRSWPSSCSPAAGRCASRDARSFGRASLIGCLLPGANSILFFAERNVPTGLASLIIASVPFWVPRRGCPRANGSRGRRWPASGSASPGSASCAAFGRREVVGHRAPRLLRRHVGDRLVPVGATRDAGGPDRRDIARDARGRIRDAADLALHRPPFSPSAGSIAGWTTSFVGLGRRRIPRTCGCSRTRRWEVSTHAYVNPVVAIPLGVRFRGEHLTWRLPSAQ